MLPAGHFLGRSPSHLPHRFTPYPLVRFLCKSHILLDHPANRGLLPNLEAPFELSRHTLLWSPHSAGTLPPHNEYRRNSQLSVKIGITNHPSAKKIPHPIKTIIAGAAPTAHLLAQLESKGFQSVHVYGL